MHKVTFLKRDNCFIQHWSFFEILNIFFNNLNRNLKLLLQNKFVYLPITHNNFLSHILIKIHYPVNWQQYQSKMAKVCLFGDSFFFNSRKFYMQCRIILQVTLYAWVDLNKNKASHELSSAQVAFQQLELVN